ncbi:aminodeoxychorismate lyase [Lysobacteraceae bacterium NML07-0707]|nr:aminodeoxychorismate lyase [Xanthomonadaceae bacterium NML07-0707]
MTWRLFQGDAPLAAIPADERGLHYGESLFETLRSHRGELPWWTQHWARLAAGAARLGLPLPDACRVKAEALQLLAGQEAALKLRLSRSGGRGYAAPDEGEPLWMLSVHPLPAPQAPLRLVWCDTQLGLQPQLAGLKHGNRLEQILARREVQQQGADEGLVCDSQGHVISATSANLFILEDGQWHTPALQSAGVAGICREHLLDISDAAIKQLTRDDVKNAEAVFICNALRGIQPVRQLGAQIWPQIHPAIATLQTRLASTHPGLRIHPEAS